MHNWDQVVNVYSLHLFNVRGNGLERREANIKVDIIKMSLIKGVKVQKIIYNLAIKPCENDQTRWQWIIAMRLGPGSVQGAGGSECRPPWEELILTIKKSQKHLCIYAILLQSIKCSNHDENAGSLLRSPHRELLTSKGEKWA